MKREFIYSMVFAVVFFISTSATIINIPADYPTIQQGIDASSDGDTVLVQPGTYVENVNFNGHNIVLGSLFLTTGDTSYISSTIIDGDSSGSVVTFENGEDSAAVITGFTIQKGYADEGGGIYCFASHPNIRSNTIRDNSSDDFGGGIYCRDSDANIRNNTIIRNSTYSYGNGGGICCFHGQPVISNNTISGNSGNGIDCNYSIPLIENTILWYNTPGEVSGYYCSPVITYCDIQGGWEGEGNIDANPLFIDPCNSNYNVCAQSPCIDSGDPDMEDPDGTRSDIGVFYPEHPECNMGNIWYVSTVGNDTTGDGSHDNPFRTIQHAVDISFNGDTIIAENGIYVENVIINFKNIVLASNYIFSGDTLDIFNTIIDGDSSGSVVTFENGEDSTAVIAGFTVQNGYASAGGGISCYNSGPIVSNNIICENLAEYCGGGIYCNPSNPTIINSTICRNSANWGCGAFGGHIINCIISENSAEYEGGGICGEGSIINCTISGNTATNGGGLSCWYSISVISDNIIDENMAIENGGGIFCHTSIQTIRNNKIIRNRALGSPDIWTGGGGICCVDSKPLIKNNVIIENTTNSYGGGIFILGGYPWDGHPKIINNTVSGNLAVRGGGIYFWDSQAIITNTILWADTADIDNEIYLEYGWPLLSFCDIQDTLWPGMCNISCNPLFCYPDTGNFYLAENSCCVGAGCDSLGIPDTTVNIGALDVGCTVIGCDYVPGDLNGDGRVMGNDVTYGVRYFEGIGAPPPDSCWNDSTESWLYSAGDANGNCRFTGTDVLFLINFDGNPEIFWCPQTPPVYPPAVDIKK